MCNKMYTSVLILFLYYLKMVTCCTTPTFRNTLINVTIEENNNTLVKNLTVAGCIGPTQEFQRVTKIECINQNIVVLQKNAVANLEKLQELSLINNNMAVIVPGAIVNLANVSKIKITSNKIVKLLPETFANILVREIDLSENRISSIGKRAFYNLQYLKDVNLNRNKIKVWDPEWFENSRNVSHLRFSENLIETLPAEAFKSIPSLSVIYLNRNRIATLHPRTFAGKRSLFALDLSDNRIKEFDKNLFTPLNGEPEEPEPGNSNGFSIRFSLRSVFSGIVSLDIHGNNLTYLPSKMLDDLGGNRRMSTLNMHSNPWQCACYDKIKDWANKNSLRVDSVFRGCIDKKNPVCVTPLHNPEVCHEQLDEELYEIFYTNFKPPVQNIFNRDISCI